MIIMYTRKPSDTFTQSVQHTAMHDTDWLYFAEAVDAKNKAERLMAYLTDVAKDDAAISEDIVTYIMTGKDYYSFAKEVKEKLKS